VSTTTLIVILLAVLAGSFLKSIGGLGLPLMAVPIISFVADVETAVAVLAFPNLLINVGMAWRTRAHRHEARDLTMLGVTGFVGAVGGTMALIYLPNEPLVGLLVLVVIGYVIKFVLSPDLRVDEATSARWAPGVGLVVGAMQGAIGISGPILGVWIHSFRLSRDATIFSLTLLFSLAGAAQVPTLWLNGELSGRYGATLLSCIPALAIIPVGERLRSRLSSAGFDRFVLVVLASTVTVLALRTFL
jgi:uncharacterized membrane protein YfcA